jgi:hypothetical protein
MIHLNLRRIEKTSARPNERRAARTKREALQGPASVFYHMEQARIIAVGLLTRQDLDLLGASFSRAWPVEQTPDFAELLRAIDTADSDLSREVNSGFA